MAETRELPKRPEHTMKATIEQMDNGALMIIRRHASNTQAGVIMLKKVYTDFESLAEDLKKHMEFRFD